MAFDGFVIANLTNDIKNTLCGQHISKISQPEKDEIILTVRKDKENIRLLLSANPSLPLLLFSSRNKTAPLTAPNFCMLLRKHIGSGQILDVYQPGLERVVVMEIEHPDEMGDIRRVKLVTELMGKHSNIILCDENDVIIDAIRRISSMQSSVREVLPGRKYFIPKTLDKLDPFSADIESFCGRMSAAPQPLFKALYQNITGMSPVMASELCHRAGLDGDLPASSFEKDEIVRLHAVFDAVISDVKNRRFSPVLITENAIAQEYSAFPLTCFEGGDFSSVSFDSISQLLETFYEKKGSAERMRQRSGDLKKLVSNLLERARKKYELQEIQLADTEKKDKYRIYGELINTYGYSLSGKEKSLTCPNYYDEGREICIPLDADLTAQENAKKYFSRYGKLKRTADALKDLLPETKLSIDHLESMATAIDLAESEADLDQIRRELKDYGYVKKGTAGQKETRTKSVPYHFISAEGFDVYVGKNNYQNEEVTFRMASGSDWWFHAKGVPGSHVVVRCGQQQPSDTTFEAAAALAAWFSKNRGQAKAEVDYTQRRNVKKAGGPPGFVIYHTNFSMMAVPGISLPAAK